MHNNQLAGLVALLLPIFTSFSILLFFYSGVVFNIINVGIILPFAYYCVIKWLMTGSKRHAIVAVCLFALFAVFHSTGIYLPFILLAGLITLIVYKKVQRQLIPKWLILLAAAVAVCGAMLFVLFHRTVRNWLSLIGESGEDISGLVLLQESLLHYMSPIVLAIIIISVAFLYGKYQHMLVAEKLTIAFFGLSAIIMMPSMLFGWSPIPSRQGLDFAIFLSIVAVALAGSVVRLDKSHVVAVVLVVLVLGGASIHISNWVGGYNSALEKVDIEAIHYIKGLQGESYSCGDNVDYFIYGRYVGKEYVSTRGDVFISRNIPMKSRVVLSNQGDLDVWRQRGAYSKATFEDTGIMIEVYSRGVK